MEAKVVNLQEKSAARFSYSRVLRCIGQSLETLELRAFDLKCQGDTYLLQGWHKQISSSVDLEERYTPEEIARLESEGQKKRRGLSRKASLFSLSHILRLAGNYVDHIEGRLLRISWQYQSDKIQAITIQYETWEDERKKDERAISTIDEICLHIYKQRKRIAGSFEQSAHRASGSSPG